MELLPNLLRETKLRPSASVAMHLEDSTHEKGYLRQEIVFYQESRNAKLTFHSQTLEEDKGQKPALKELSEKLALADSRLER